MLALIVKPLPPDHAQRLRRQRVRGAATLPGLSVAAEQTGGKPPYAHHQRK